MKLLSHNGWIQLRRAILLLCLTSGTIESQMTSEGGELTDFIASEQQRSSVLTYSQSYTDDHVFTRGGGTGSKAFQRSQSCLFG